MVDLKIALRDLYAIHSASLILEHGIRQTVARSPWQAFSPSRFIYAFFTFNGIYSWDWTKSFAANETRNWDKVTVTGKKPRRIYETEQISGLLDFYYINLGPDTPALVADSVDKMLLLFGISDPGNELARIDVTNETAEMKKFRRKFPTAFDKLAEPTTASTEHHQALHDALNFIYRVRCNIFHGSKNTIHMKDPGQQSRLLIYTAVLIATNGLLFEIADRAGIQWITPQLNWKTV